MPSNVLLGSSYKAAYMTVSVNQTVTALIRGPSTDNVWVDLPLTEISTPQESGRVFVADYSPSKEGWHLISYKTDPPGGEQGDKFYCEVISDVVTQVNQAVTIVKQAVEANQISRRTLGTIVSSTSSTEVEQ